MSTPPSNLLASHANCLPIGTVIADFEVIGLVGEGGFGIVYLAKDINLDRIVAVKEFMPSAFAGRVDGTHVAVRSGNHQATYQAGLRSFINEAKMLAKFAHPALVEVYRFWEANGTAYMAMRYYAGETLRQKLTHGNTVFDEETIAQTMAPIFDALEMLHREQVYHRDVAPDNIMVTDGHPVLLDFGSARRIIGDGTQALTTVLKPGYAPIEQYVDDGTMKQGPWTDVYALGGVLYHLATGKPPLQAVSRLLSDPLQSVNEVTSNRFSASFSGAVAKAMAVRVEDRLQNVREFSEMLGWNTAKPTRVMTLPGAALATSIRAAEEPVSTDAPAVAATSPATQVKSAGEITPDTPGKAGSATQTGKDATAVDWEFPDISTRGETPAHRPEIIPKKDKLVPLLTVGLGLAAIVFYVVTRPADPVAPIAPSAPSNLPVLAPSKDAALAATVAASAAQAEVPPPAAAAATGLVKLNISPWGTVVVDGVTRGISNATQLRQLELSVGKHTIEIAKPDEQPHQQTIEVVENAPITITHKFK